MYLDVTSFHVKYRLEYVGAIRALPQDLYDFRCGFLAEEFDEYIVDAEAAVTSSTTSDHANTTHHLEKSLDALVDYVYVALGTAYLQGMSEAQTPQGQVEYFMNNVAHYNGEPRAVPKFWVENFGEVLLSVMAMYQQSVSEESLSLTRSFSYLCDSCYLCFLQAEAHGFNFDEAWRRVHEANMKKIRAERASDSKRGSTFDVIKPPGWEPPSHKDLVENHIHRTVT